MPCYNTATRKHLQRVLCRQCSYTDHAAKQCTGLYSGFSCDCTRSTAYNTRPTQAAIIPPATRWSTPQRRSTSSTYQIPAPRRTLYRPAEPPIIIRYIKSAPLLWIHARRCNIPQTIPARRGQLLPPVDRWQMLHLAHLLRGQCLHLHKVSPAASRYFPSPTACNLAPGQRSGHTLHPVGQSSGRGRGGRRGTIGGFRRSSFRAFAR